MKNFTTATETEKKVLADLINANRKAIAYFNAKAQRQTLGLSEDDDNLRQELCNAHGAATGTVLAGNLQRTHETRSAIERAEA